MTKLLLTVEQEMGSPIPAVLDPVDEVITRALDLIRSPIGWIKGEEHEAYDADGEDVTQFETKFKTEPEICGHRFCSIGAVREAATLTIWGGSWYDDNGLYDVVVRNEDLVGLEEKIGDLYMLALARLYHYLPALWQDGSSPGDEQPLIEFNDSTNREHWEVVELFEKALGR
jgi:hypothetical protein